MSAGFVYVVDEQIDALQNGKRAFYTTVREEHGKQYANGLKEAVRISRMSADKRLEAEAADEEAFRILRLIEAAPAARRAPRVREMIDEFDAETGEIQESEAARPSGPTTELVTRSADESVIGREDVTAPLPAPIPAPAGVRA